MCYYDSYCYYCYYSDLPADGGPEGPGVHLCPCCAPTSWWQVLQEKFSEFASETGTAGRERLAAVNQMVDELIECGHTAAATMAEWKDGLNEAWAELLELMGTRAQLLAASRELHKFFSDARELQGQIEEKRRRLPHLTTPPEPRPSASSMQRTLRAFEHDLQLLVSQVG